MTLLMPDVEDIFLDQIRSEIIKFKAVYNSSTIELGAYVFGIVAFELAEMIGD